MHAAVPTLLRPTVKDLGDATVRRALPAPQLAAVGPFVFFDEMGPAEFAAGRGLDVRPHPHIGLATVTFLFAGEILHRDSLGTVQAIRPGEVNWMVAGRGIVHSERTAQEQRHRPHCLHGIQTWLALPRSDEEAQPGFVHFSAASLPTLALTGGRLTVIAGTAFGATSPVAVPGPTLYVEVQLEAGAEMVIPDEHQERAMYVIRGAVTIGSSSPVEAGTMAVLATGAPVTVVAADACHAMLIGGAALDGPRHLWWNLVASDRARIERAANDWQASIDAGFSGGRFSLPPDEQEHIPLPG
jgi:redox-sensitive bicupin YhaK (pirin superfamily)